MIPHEQMNQMNLHGSFTWNSLTGCHWLGCCNVWDAQRHTQLHGDICLIQQIGTEIQSVCISSKPSCFYIVTNSFLMLYHFMEDERWKSEKYTIWTSTMFQWSSTQNLYPPTLYSYTLRPLSFPTVASADLTQSFFIRLSKETMTACAHLSFFRKFGCAQLHC